MQNRYVCKHYATQSLCRLQKQVTWALKKALQWENLDYYINIAKMKYCRL